MGVPVSLHLGLAVDVDPCLLGALDAEEIAADGTDVHVAHEDHLCAVLQVPVLSCA